MSDGQSINDDTYFELGHDFEDKSKIGGQIFNKPFGDKKQNLVADVERGCVSLQVRQPLGLCCWDFAKCGERKKVKKKGKKFRACPRQARCH